MRWPESPSSPPRLRRLGAYRARRRGDLRCGPGALLDRLHDQVPWRHEGPRQLPRLCRGDPLRREGPDQVLGHGRDRRGLHRHGARGAGQGPEGPEVLRRREVSEDRLHEPLGRENRPGPLRRPRVARDPRRRSRHCDPDDADGPSNGRHRLGATCASAGKARSGSSAPTSESSAATSGARRRSPTRWTIEIAILGNRFNFDKFGFDSREKPSIGEPLAKALRKAGPRGRRAVSRAEGEEPRRYNFGADQVCDRGNRLLQHRRLPEALALFDLAAAESPKEANLHARVGEVNAAMGAIATRRWRPTGRR